MEWLEPWWSADELDENVRSGLERQLVLEVPPGHEMFQVPVRLIGRGNGDDALFQILDGSGRVAVVHLTWSKSQERLPWPATTVFLNLKEWADTCMLPEHQEWSS